MYNLQLFNFVSKKLLIYHETSRQQAKHCQVAVLLHEEMCMYVKRVFFQSDSVGEQIRDGVSPKCLNLSIFRRQTQCPRTHERTHAHVIFIQWTPLARLLLVSRVLTTPLCSLLLIYSLFAWKIMRMSLHILQTSSASLSWLWEDLCYSWINRMSTQSILTL